MQLQDGYVSQLFALEPFVRTIHTLSAPGTERMRGWARKALASKKDDSQKLSNTSSFRSISKMLAAANHEELAEGQRRKAKITEEVERERQEKLKQEGMAEDAKFKAEKLRQEQEERRSNLKRGIRAHHQLRELDSLVLLLQADENAKLTKYLDWRDDILKAVSSLLHGTPAFRMT